MVMKVVSIVAMAASFLYRVVRSASNLIIRSETSGKE
jgi:hypothetical protein